MDGWILTDDPCRGSLLMPSAPGPGPIGPRYRGAFEPGERPPRRIRAALRPERPRRSDGPAREIESPGDGPTAVSRSGKMSSVGAAARLRGAVGIPGIGGGRSFGVSVLVTPEIWTPAGVGGGWHFFRSGEFFLGLWSSLPATWLAQDDSGTPLDPPWRELWTFGTDHLWICRIGRFVGEEATELFAGECRSLGYPADFGPERSRVLPTEDFAGRDRGLIS